MSNLSVRGSQPLSSFVSSPFSPLPHLPSLPLSSLSSLSQSSPPLTRCIQSTNVAAHISASFAPSTRTALDVDRLLNKESRRPAARRPQLPTPSEPVRAKPAGRRPRAGQGRAVERRDAAAVPGLPSPKYTALIAACHFAEERLDGALNELTAYDALIRGLAGCKGGVAATALGSFIPAFQELLVHAKAISMQNEVTSSSGRSGIAKTMILDRLAAGKTVTFAGGYASNNSGHFVTVLIFPPDAQGHCLVTLLNRGLGIYDYHTGDDRKRPQPLIARVNATHLFSQNGLNALTAMLEQQTGKAGYTLDRFYQATAELIGRRGELLLGTLGGTSAQRLIYPGQTPQKGGTCAIHSNFAMLQFLMYQWFRAVSLNPTDPGINDTLLDQARTLYKQLRGEMRLATARDVIAARRVAQSTGDLQGARLLARELTRIHAWLSRQDRDGKPARDIELQILDEVRAAL